ncbi:MAG: zf-TFIIB domain-containing protein [Nitrospinota bacterium]|nr:zf-TFIIB domain-containing protein [Nitrospinota bacterium]MDH5756523.1 zf-TFIIB domain-containing protein [Nitrospinota bacterium]
MTEQLSKEEEYFARQEFERRKKLEEDLRAKMAEEEKQKQKELHYMHCPKCGAKLVEISHKDIKVDKCSGCEGIWLDPGELEQIATDETHGFKGFLGLFSK